MDFHGKIDFDRIFFRASMFDASIVLCKQFILMSVVSRRNVFLVDALRICFDSFKHGAQYFLIGYEIPPMLVCSETILIDASVCRVWQVHARDISRN